MWDKLTHVCSKMYRKEMGSDPILVIAHRGDSAHHLENTIVAFQKAVAAGANMIELDVRLTADQHPVVFHDSNLRRLFGKKGRIARLTYAHIRERSKDQIPLLRDVLHRLRGQISFYIEVKAERLRARHRELLVRKVWEDIRRAGTSQTCLVASFDYRVPMQYRGLDPAAKTGFIFSRRGALRPAKKDGFRHVDVVCPHKSLLNGHLVHAFHERKKMVYPWVLDRSADQRKALELGADGIVTNDPGGLRRHLLSGNLTPKTKG